jgi:hypothetical protein
LFQNVVQAGALCGRPIADVVSRSPICWRHIA